MSKKRPRGELTSGQGKWWENAVAWVQSDGGKIHPSLTLSENREPYSQKKIEEGEELLRIPNSCLVSWTTVEQDGNFGRKITDAISSIDANKFYSQKQDLAIALFLAASNAVSTNKFQPYLDTLPDSSTYDALPRRWTEEELCFLKGTSICSRVQQQKEGIQKDYILIRDSWKQREGKENDFPRFESFSDRLAAVSSRAFAGFGDSSDNGDDMDVALVPLLDLCDHCRGEENVSKNISYQKIQADSSCSSIVTVTARRSIEPGEELRITYGAQANSQLLLNYGFCIPDNVEPDGSSNDFLEFIPEYETANSQSVQLRAGPKAHSFYGFLNAVDAFRAGQKTKGCERVDEADNDSAKDATFEENEQEFADWEFDISMDILAGEDEDDEEDDKEALKKQQEKTTESYLDALSALRKRLLGILEGYHLSADELKKASQQKTASKAKYFAALLVQSECRTIYFILIVIEKIEDFLRGTKLSSSTTIQSSFNVTEGDIALLTQQSRDLATAFIKLRVPYVKAL